METINTICCFKSSSICNAPMNVTGFMLPSEYRILIAAYVSIILGASKDFLKEGNWHFNQMLCETTILL